MLQFRCSPVMRKVHGPPQDLPAPLTSFGCRKWPLAGLFWLSIVVLLTSFGCWIKVVLGRAGIRTTNHMKAIPEEGRKCRVKNEKKEWRAKQWNWLFDWYQNFTWLLIWVVTREDIWQWPSSIPFPPCSLPQRPVTVLSLGLLWEAWQQITNLT